MGAHSAGKWYGDAEADKGLQTTQDARFYSISSKIATPFTNKDKKLVIQFSVKHAQKIDCGGGYLKILGTDADLAHFSGDTNYNIMFGPDICGYSTKKVHAIFNYKGKNLLIKKEVECETDQLTHVYTLIVNPDNTYEIKIDGTSKQTGSLEDDWDFLAPKKIKDPAQSKPEDWDDEADGTWEPPLIDNPEFKGEWKAKRISNPA